MSTTAAAKQGNRILIVEDDPVLRDTLALTLRTHGYGVTGVPDGVNLIELATAGSVDLIILDVMLPDLDGLSACRALRTAGVEVPVLMLSARGGDLDKIVGLEAGADDYVTKPFSTGELLARVRALLRRTPARRDTILESGDLVIDLAGRRAWRAGQELRLTPKEFNLLAELMQSPGVVLSRDLLLEKVWGYDYIGDSRTVDVHIRWLREKIEAAPSAPLRIVTVRGIGYRFEG